MGKINNYLTRYKAIKETKKTDPTLHYTNFIDIADGDLSLKIYKDDIIRNKFFSGYSRSKPVVWFVIHGTGGGGTLNWIRNTDPKSERGQGYCKGLALFHYLIEENGIIWEIIDPSKWVWHASVGNFDGGTIGVELLNTSSNNSKPYTPQQYNSLYGLYNYLRINSFPEMKTMISHNRAKKEISNGTKKCPGKGFDWNMWKNKVAQQYSFKYDNFQKLWDLEPIE